MDLKELIPHIITFAGLVFGFGWQGAVIKQSRLDIKNIGSSHREILDKLKDLEVTLGRIDQRLIYLEKPVNRV